MNNIINQPSLAIIIDPYFVGRFTDKTPLETLYEQIILFLDSNENIKTVILAAYDCNIPRKKSEHNLWYTNYRRFMNTSTTRIMKDLFHIHRFYLQSQLNSGMIDLHTPDPLILNYINHDKFQIAMTWGWELTQYLSQNTELKNVYILGSAWSQCVKTRPLGYDAISEFKNVNVLTNIDCIYDKVPINLDQDNRWQKINHKIFLLKNSTAD